MNIEDYAIIITLVPHGYEIDLVESNYLSLISRKFKHSECRDYGGNIDVAKVSEKIIELVRNAEGLEKQGSGKAETYEYICGKCGSLFTRKPDTDYCPICRYYSIIKP